MNIASLTLTRAVGRTRELAVRAALGAGRARLVNQLLVESALLAVVGGGAGLLLASWATQGIAALDAGLGIPLLDQTRPDGTVVAFTSVVALLAALLFGTLPAWHASRRRMSRGASGKTRGPPPRVANDSGCAAASSSRKPLSRSFCSSAPDCCCGASDGWRRSISARSLSRADVQPVVAAAETHAGIARGFRRNAARSLAARTDVESAGRSSVCRSPNFRYVISTSTIDGRTLTDDEPTRRSAGASRDA